MEGNGRASVGPSVHGGQGRWSTRRPRPPS